MSTTSNFVRNLRRASSVRSRQNIIDAYCRSSDEAIVANSVFRDVNLDQLYFGRMHFQDCIFAGVNCRGTTWGPAERCCFDKSNAAGSRFMRLNQCSFRDSVLDFSEFSPSIFRCDFRSANLIRSLFLPQVVFGTDQLPSGDNVFDCADLRYVDARGVDFHRTSFVNSNASHALFSRARFRECRMVGMRFVGAVLCGAALDRSRLSRSQRESCEFFSPISESAGLSFCHLANCLAIKTAAKKLARALKSIRRFRMCWRMRRVGTLQMELVTLFKSDAATSKVQWSVFSVPEMRIIRLIPSFENDPITDSFMQIANYYAGWSPILDSVDFLEVSRFRLASLRQSMVEYLEKL